MTSPPMPLAIIGMGCRFAGEASSPEKLWKLCAEAKSAFSEFPASRFNKDAFYHPNGQKLNTMNVKGGHFLSEDVALFDANFFNFTSELASVYDPQFRLQLELTYEALENAGLSLQDVAGSNTSVFAGSFFHDYSELHMRDPETLPRALLVSTGAAMAANRLSHFYDLRGQSMTLDTGCSTTLTAFHQACESIKSGDSDMSIISASNVILNPDNFMVMSSAFLSEAGRSYAFDHRAAGYGRGEGSATVIVKRLDYALRDNDPIRAVVRATALNQDGKTETITTPSQQAQADLIRECYRKAGLNPADTTYFEAHGTGTPTGDPIEAGAVASGFSQNGQRKDLLKIGSVKTNIGHTETVSGIASIIKVVMALQNKQIPPSINFEKPNPNIPFEQYRLQIPTKLEDWAAQNGIRRASINNFGYGGANAHVIVEDYSTFINTTSQHLIQNPTLQTTISPRSRLFSLSGKDEQAATRIATNLLEHLREVSPGSEQDYLNSLAYTLGQRRSKLPWTNVQSASTLKELTRKLDASKSSPRKTQEKPKVAFVFTGQGAQWWAMGRELIEAYPIFKSTITEANGYLQAMGCTWDLLEELNKSPENTRVNELAFSTPLSAVVQISVVELLKSWGVTASALCSHSSGEVAAAYASGSLTLRAAMAVVFARGQIAGKTIPGVVEKRGAMIATGLGAEELERVYLSRLPPCQVVVACLNSPSSTTASGDSDAVDKLERMLKADGVFGRRLKIDCAYHSHHMEALSPTYKQWLDPLIHGDGVMRSDVIYSSPTTGGRETDGGMISAPQHWVNSFARPVQFTKALHAMCFADEEASASDVDVIVEIGPHATLAGPIQEICGQPIFKGAKIQYFPTLVRKSNAVDTMHALACELIRAGHPLELGQVNFPTGLQSAKVLHDLPTYPWNHSKRHWSEPRMNRSHRFRTHTDHDLLGSLALGTNMLAPTWRHVLRLSDLPWLRDHHIQTDIVFPAAGYICMAIQGALQLAEIKGETLSGYRLKDIEVLLALVIPDTAEGIEIQMTFGPPDSKALYNSGWTEFHVYSITQESTWTEHMTGLIQTDVAPSGGEVAVPQTATTRLARHAPMDEYRKALAPADVYSALHNIEVKHGPIFQNLTQVKARNNQAVATFTVADTAATQPYKFQHSHVVHPTTLDILFQFGYGNYIATPSANLSASFVPRTIKGLYVAHNISSRAGHVFRAYSEIVGETAQSFDADLVVVDHASDGTAKPVMSVDHYITRSLGEIKQPEESYKKLAKISWRPDVSRADTSVLQKAVRKVPVPVEATSVNVERTNANIQRLSMSYLHQAIRNISQKDVALMQPHHKYLYYWMLLRAELGFNNKVFDNEDEDDLHAETFMKDIEASLAGRLLCEVGPRLALLLKGELELSEVVTDLSDLDKHFSEPAGYAACAEKLATYVQLLAHKNSKLRILQVSAKDHKLSSTILAKIGDCAEDIIQKFEVTAKSEDIVENLETGKPIQQYVTSKTLDVEKNAEAQGFEAGSYDLVIVDQASAAFVDRYKALTNIKKLLKPSASLVVTDARRDLLDRWLVLGLLPEWWREADENGGPRPASSTSTWETALRDAGFNGSHRVFYDTDHKEQHSSRLFISTNPVEESVANYPPTTIVVEDNTSAKEHLHELAGAFTNITGQETIIETLQNVRPEGKICVFLGDIDRPFLKDPTSEEFIAMRDMSVNSKGLLWLTTGATSGVANIDHTLSQGFLRTLRTEYAGKRAIALDLDTQQGTWSQKSIAGIESVFKASFDYSKQIDDFEFALRDGAVNVPRFYKDYERNTMFVPASAKRSKAELQPFHQPGRRLKLSVGSPGLLDSLAFVDTDDADLPLKADEVEIRPAAFGGNFRDVMSAMGQLSTDVLGFECAGTIARVGSDAAKTGLKTGDRVAALMNGDYSNAVRTKGTNAVKIPDNLSFGDAAAVPHSYATAWICLNDLAHLAKGESVLIHAASGGLGQAAIAIAQHVGANVFATASTSEKRDFLNKTYGIRADQIYNSRDKSFFSGVLRTTGGKGVDVVLNSLSGTLLQESFNCVARFGRFIELGTKDFESGKSLQMEAFTRNVSFSSFDILQYIEHRGPQVQQALTKAIGLLKDETISKIRPVITRPLAEIEKTLRTLQSGKHVGKQVLTVSDSELVKVAPHDVSVKLQADASYLVVGGLGGIGRTVCEWLIARGARNIIVMSRSATAGKIKSFADEAADLGCRVYAQACDIADKESVDAAFEICSKVMPPIRGVIQGAMVLQDSLVERMSPEQWNGAVRPKVHGSWNLHEKLASKDVDFFVLLSSLSGIVGLPSQCNYAAGNAYQDALAKYRRSLGFHGAAVDIGVVQAVGVVAENDKLAAGLKHWKALTEEQVLRIIGSAITTSPEDPILMGIEGSDWATSGLDRDRRFAPLMPRSNGNDSGPDSKGTMGELAAAIATASTFEEAGEAVVKAVVKQLVDIFMMDESDVDATKSLTTYGVDSLSAVELRNMLALRAGAEVSIFEIMQAASVNALGSVIAARSSYIDANLVPKKD